MDGKVWCHNGELRRDGSKWLNYSHEYRRIDDFPGIVVQIGTVDWRESKQRRPQK
jgi:hypothetical protein